MNLDLSGHHSLDGKDIWTAYNIFVESGSEQFLRAPERKESITHDWGDSHGIDVDASRVFLKDRDIVLNCAIIVETPDEFWNKFNGFLQDLIQPEKRRWEVAVYEGYSYYVLYRKMDNVQIFTKWRNTTLIAGKFQLTLHEPSPTIGQANIHIVDEDGRFLIT